MHKKIQTYYIPIKAKKNLILDLLRNNFMLYKRLTLQNLNKPKGHIVNFSPPTKIRSSAELSSIIPSLVLAETGTN